jgi:hypothetical protein
VLALLSPVLPFPNVPALLPPGLPLPKALLFVAIDGVAPVAKISQQRERRYTSALRAEVTARAEERVRRSLEAELGVVCPSLPHFDGNVRQRRHHLSKKTRRREREDVEKTSSREREKEREERDKREHCPSYRLRVYEVCLCGV